MQLVLVEEGGRHRGGTVIELGETFKTLRDEHAARMIALRNGDSERQLVARMMAHHELRRRQVSPNLDPVQLSLGEEP